MYDYISLLQLLTRPMVQYGLVLGYIGQSQATQQLQFPFATSRVLPPQYALQLLLTK